MKLERLTRAQRLTLTLTLGLVLLTIAFPWADYEYSAGFPRGAVVYELETHKFQHDYDDTFFIGRSNYYQGFGVVPCWNIQGKHIRWSWVLTQAGAFAVLGAAAVLVNPAPRRRRSPACAG